jgi:hypothetical protein
MKINIKGIKDSQVGAVQPEVQPDGLAVSRRNMLWGSAAALLGLGLVAPASTLLAAPATVPSAASPAQLDSFMKFSRFATGHEHLDRAIGQRLYEALCAHSAAFPANLAQLQQLAAQQQPSDVEPFEVLLRGQPLHADLLAIVSAWYSGVVETGSTATLYAYERALMYQPARDGVVIPTYAHNGPDYWVAEPPPLERMPSF